MAARKQAGFIYAIGVAGTGIVKIGHTCRPIEKRFAALQHAHADPLCIIACTEVTTNLLQLERAIHRHLYSVRCRGEWFAIELDQAKFDALILQVITKGVAQVDPASLKRCPDCGDKKARREFGKNRGTLDGHSTYCKECAAKRCSHYRSTHLEEVRASGRQCYHRNSEQRHAYRMSPHGKEIQRLKDLRKRAKRLGAMASQQQQLFTM